MNMAKDRIYIFNYVHKDKKQNTNISLSLVKFCNLWNQCDSRFRKRSLSIACNLEITKEQSPSEEEK